MHIMIVIHSLRSGGAERVTADLSSYWHRLGYKVSVVTQLSPDTDIYPLAEGVQRHVLHTAYDTGGGLRGVWANRSEEHTSELQSRGHIVCRLLLEKKKKIKELIICII